MRPPVVPSRIGWTEGGGLKVTLPGPPLLVRPSHVMFRKPSPALPGAAAADGAPSADALPPPLLLAAPSAADIGTVSDPARPIVTVFCRLPLPDTAASAAANICSGDGSVASPKPNRGRLYMSPSGALNAWWSPSTLFPNSAPTAAAVAAGMGLRAASGCTAPPELDTLLPNRPLLLPPGNCQRAPPAATAAGPGTSAAAAAAAGGCGAAAVHVVAPPPVDTCSPAAAGGMSIPACCATGERCTGDSGSSADATKGLSRRSAGAAAASETAAAAVAACCLVSSDSCGLMDLGDPEAAPAWWVCSCRQVKQSQRRQPTINRSGAASFRA